MKEAFEWEKIVNDDIEFYMSLFPHSKQRISGVSYLVVRILTCPNLDFQKLYPANYTRDDPTKCPNCGKRVGLSCWETIKIKTKKSE